MEVIPQPCGLVLGLTVTRLGCTHFLGAKKLGCKVPSEPFFDTVVIGVPGKAQAVLDAGYAKGINLCPIDSDTVSVSFDETTKVNHGTPMLRQPGMKCTDRKQNRLAIPCSYLPCVQLSDVDELFSILSLGSSVPFTAESLASSVEAAVGPMARTSKFLQQPIFNLYHSEHEMLRYLVNPRSCGDSE